MFRKSIKQKIIGIAAGLIVLAVITSALSMVLASRVGHLLDELTNRYIPAYGHLARVNIRSLERAVAIRRMMGMKVTQPTLDQAAYAEQLKNFKELDASVEQEAAEARRLINAIIDDASTPSDNAALGRLDDRIENAMNDLRRRLDEENDRVLEQLEANNFPEASRMMAHIDQLRTELNSRIDGIRADMLRQVEAGAATVVRQQRQTIAISAAVTAIAAVLGFFFAMLVGSGITRPVLRLLEGTREIEAGRLDQSISITTRDEIGQLSAAFNRMVERLRQNQRVRETFGRYIDPRIADDLLDQPALAGADGQRRTMTVLFCDMKGFTRLSEGVTPQGLVKIMNRYLSTMSEPIHAHRGIIDKYVGDAIMAYWGPPFIDEAEQADAACLAALDMVGRVADMVKELPELLGVRAIAADCDIRIGIATGEALVGSIGSAFMMSYTVMGATVNLASRLEGANNFYGSRCLISEVTASACVNSVEVREIDWVVMVGQTHAQTVYEIVGAKGALSNAQLRLRELYARGLVAYRARQWDAALEAFNAALEAVPGDGPSLALISRVEGFKQAPPPVDWDGTWRLEHK
jgi:adenylate cyclase